MATCHLDVGEPDRSKRFKQEVLGPAVLAPGAAYSRPSNAGYMPDSMQQCFTSVRTEPTALPPPASSATQSSSGNTHALPAASQQYPVLPQAAASAAAAAASALQGLAGAAQQWNPANDAFSTITKKHAQAADLQQQRRRAGPVNQWRPGMPLLAGSAQQQQQQGYPFPAPSQRPSGAGGFQSLPGGALAAALQTLLPLPGQLMAAQQLSAATAMHGTPQLLLPAGGSQQAAGQHALHVLHGPAAAAAPPAAASVLVPSAPHATLDRVALAGPVPAAAAGRAAAGLLPQTTPQPAAVTEPLGDRVASGGAAAVAGLGAGPSSSSGSPDWLKLLNCAVHPHGDSLAIELLLGGQLYKGQLTRVAHAQAAEAPTAMPAGAAVPPGRELLQLQQQQEEQVLSEGDRAALLDFAQQREGMCFLCALPFAKQGEGSVAAGQQAAGMPAAAADGDAVATAAAATRVAEGTSAPAAGQGSAGPEQEDSRQQAEQQQQEGMVILQEDQHSPASGQGDLMGSLGPAVHWDLGSGCCLSLHKACAEASVKAAAWQQLLKQEQGGGAGGPSVQQLLSCLARHCCGCDQRAATLHCAAPGCSRWFHVPCVQAMGAVQLQDGSCWCSEHQALMKKQQQQCRAGPFAAASTAAGAATTADGLSSPEPSQPAGINPSPSFAAALVLQQMRCSKGYDVLLLGPDTEPAGTNSGSNAGSRAGGGGGVTGGQARTSAQRRLLEAMPVSNSSNNSSAPSHEQPRQQYSAAVRGHSQGAGLYGSTAEGSRQYHLQQQQLGGFGAQGGAVAGPAPATTMLLQRLQQQTGNAASWQQQQQQQQQYVGPIRTSPKSAKGRPPLHAPPGKAKGAWNTLGLISAFALAQQQQEQEQHQHHQQQQQQLAVSHAAAAAAVVSGPTVVVPRVRARKGATHHTMMQ